MTPLYHIAKSFSFRGLILLLAIALSSLVSSCTADELETTPDQAIDQETFLMHKDSIGPNHQSTIIPPIIPPTVPPGPKP